MRIVHTSDWHLGKRLFETSLVEDQAHILAQIARMCREERADALVLAGDVYDRAVPPVEAVALFSDFVNEIARDLRIPLVVISGNHDSAERLGFGADVLATGKVHVISAFERRATPVVVENRKRKLHIYGLPYLEPEVARSRLGDESLVDHDRAVRAALQAMAADRVARQADQALLCAHLFAAGGTECPDSERPLLVGGAAQVSGVTLDGWTHVALGHLHAPQRVAGRDDIRYSGSILQYSFGEHAQKKSVDLVEMICGRSTVRTLPLSVRRPMLRLSARFDELLHEPRFESARGAFVEATYTDEGYVLDAAIRLRQRFPHLMAALPGRVLGQVTGVAMGERPPLRDAAAMFADFWRHVEGQAAGAGHLAAFAAALREPPESLAEAECARAS